MFCHREKQKQSPIHWKNWLVYDQGILEVVQHMVLHPSAWIGLLENLNSVLWSITIFSELWYRSQMNCGISLWVSIVVCIILPIHYKCHANWKSTSECFPAVVLINGWIPFSSPSTKKLYLGSLIWQEIRVHFQTWLESNTTICIFVMLLINKQDFKQWTRIFF